MRLVALILAVIVATPVNAQLVVSGGDSRSIVMSGVTKQSQSVASVPPTGTDADKPAQPIEYTSNDPSEQPSSKAVADLGMSLLNLSSSDLLAEIGCGNAQHLIRAVERYGCRGLGVEINGQLADAAQAAVDAAGLSDRIDILHCDAKFIDFRDVDAVYLYHFPEQLEWIAPKVAGKRVVSAFHELPGRSGRKVGDVWVYGVSAKKTQPATSTTQRFLVSEPWCIYCPQAKGRFLAAGNPASNIISIAEAKRRFGINVGSVPYEFSREVQVSRTTRTMVQPREQVFTAAVWNGRQYSAPVCNSSNCQMCNSIRRQLGGR